jgi:hypothetical protein
MKTAHHRGLQTLLFYDTKGRRRAAFIRFITNVKAIVRSVSELRDFITDFPVIKEVKSDAASTAFFRFIESKVDDAFQQHLNNLYRKTGYENGIEALRLLTKICAAQTHEQQQDNLQSLMSVKVRDGENIPRYCVRFNKLCNSVAISGICLKETQLVDYFLRSVIEITDPRLLIQIESWRRLRDTERLSSEEHSALSLEYVQTQLSELFERFNDRAIDGQREIKTQGGTKTATTQRINKSATAHHTNTSTSNVTNSSRSQNGDARSTSRRTQDKYNKGGIVQRKKFAPANEKASSDSTGATCWGCGGAHMLKSCPTTSGPDKKIIYNQHRSETRGKDAAPRNTSSYSNIAKGAQDGKNRGTSTASHTTSLTQSHNNQTMGVRFANLSQVTPSSTQRTFQASQPNLMTGVNAIKQPVRTSASSNCIMTKPAFASMALSRIKTGKIFPPLAYYEKNTVLDSVESEHMCPWLDLLTYPTETYRQVIYPDNSAGEALQ